MKTKVIPLAVLLTALSGFVVSPLTAATSDQIPARMYRVERVLVRGDFIKLGAPLALVRSTLGTAHAQITRDLWLYYNFKPPLDEVGREACGELVIGFTHDHVSSIHLVNRRAHKVLVARVNSGVVDNASVLAAVPQPALETQVARK